MKKLIAVFLTALMLMCCVCVIGCGKTPQESSSADSSTQQPDYTPKENAEITANVITINMYYVSNPENDYIKYKGQRGSDYTMNKRFTRLCALVDYYLPDVLMLQEINGRGGWWDYLVSNKDSFLNRYGKYAFVGDKNNVGGTNGSGGALAFYNQIYYNRNKYDLVAGGTFYCRDDKTSPENQFTGDFEGAYAPTNTTTCTYAVLRDKKTNVTAVYGTTHLCTRPSADYNFRSYGQARNLTEGLYEIADTYKWGEKPLPIVIGGDFNGPASNEYFYAYPHMTAEAHYTDSYIAAPTADNSGTARIFGQQINGLLGTSKNGARIDYIFAQGITVADYKVLDGTFGEDKEQTYCDYYTEPSLDGSQYDLTDHLPVFVKAKINAKGSSAAPDVYVNERYLSDNVVTVSSEINATSEKIVFDSADLLKYIGNNEKKGVSAAIVADGAGGKCLRLTADKSRIDPCISIDYALLMKDLGLEGVSADEYKKIKIEYLYSVTKSQSRVYFGASTDNMVPLTAGLNTAEMSATNSAYASAVYDFTQNADFWTGKITYLGMLSNIGLMAGDGIYIRSVEFIK